MKINKSDRLNRVLASFFFLGGIFIQSSPIDFLQFRIFIDFEFSSIPNFQLFTSIFQESPPSANIIFMRNKSNASICSELSLTIEKKSNKSPPPTFFSPEFIRRVSSPRIPLNKFQQIQMRWRNSIHRARKKNSFNELYDTFIHGIGRTSSISTNPIQVAENSARSTMSVILSLKHEGSIEENTKKIAMSFFI